MAVPPGNNLHRLCFGFAGPHNCIPKRTATLTALGPSYPCVNLSATTWFLDKAFNYTKPHFRGSKIEGSSLPPGRVVVRGSEKTHINCPEQKRYSLLDPSLASRYFSVWKVLSLPGLEDLK